ncbi:hypothetical protein TrVE_jg5827 [Triparma verrucosa]|uniref:Uncharacterized protein n=1 Tax=Triparma verrucosa TaxID=1606542 RepID=A0A9W7C2I7_9STRA|nr:hypothetical protein TrVE_jg5827 [Triparma verrucosa]
MHVFILKIPERSPRNNGWFFGAEGFLECTNLLACSPPLFFSPYVTPVNILVKYTSPNHQLTSTSVQVTPIPIK